MLDSGKLQGYELKTREFINMEKQKGVIITPTELNISNNMFDTNKICDYKKEITELIQRMRANIVKCNPVELLNLAASETLSKNIGTDSEIDVDWSELTQQIAPYIQSVLVSSENEFTGNLDSFIEETCEIFIEIKGDYHKLSLLEQLVSGAIIAHGKDFEKYSDEEKQIIYEAQVLYKVTGKRYPIHEHEYFMAVFPVQESILQESFSISVDEIVSGIDKLRHALSNGKFAPFAKLVELHEKFVKEAENSTFEQTLEIIESQQSDAISIMDEMKGTWSVDVINVTDWSVDFVKELSFGLNESSSFFSENEYAGWSGSYLPVKDRPFLCYANKYYCFDYHLLVDNFYRAVHHAVCRVLPSTKEKWNENQQFASEKKTAELFQELLPGSLPLSTNYFPQPKEGYNESDLLVLYSDTLFIIEIKAGAYAHTAPLTDFNSYMSRSKKIIEKAGVQAQRVLKYLLSQKQADFFSDAGCKNKKATLDLNNISDIYLMSVSLDDMTHFAAKAEKLKFLQLADDLISLSVSAIMTYRDYFDSPLNFLHYIKQRIRATKIPLIALNDELDHLGLYIDQNCYCKTPNEFPDDVTRVFYVGYRQELDYWLSGKFRESLGLKNANIKPTQKVPPTICDIIRLLEVKKVEHREMLSNYLLDYSSDSRNDFCDNIRKVTIRQRDVRAVIPTSSSASGEGISTYEKYFSYTVFIRQEDVKYIERVNLLNTDEQKKYVYSLIARNKEQMRFLIALDYDYSDNLVDVSFHICRIEDIEQEQFDELAKYGEEIAKRVFHAQKVKMSRKIGRNEPCLCGSGCKYKKCCLT